MQKLLMVDDDPTLLGVFQRVLGVEYDLHTASDGLDALRVMEESGPFPVMVTDLRMPNMNGAQLVRRTQDDSPGTVCVMLTGNRGDEAAQQLISEGLVYRVLQKPCLIEEILTAVTGANQVVRSPPARRLLDRSPAIHASPSPAAP